MTQTITATSHGLFLIIPNKGIPNNNNKHRNGDGLKLGNYIIYAYICISINKSSRFWPSQNKYIFFFWNCFRLITAPKLRDFGLCTHPWRPHHTTARLMIFANLGSNGTSNRTPTKTMFVHSNNSKFCFGFEKTIPGLPTNCGAWRHSLWHQSLFEGYWNNTVLCENNTDNTTLPFIHDRICWTQENNTHPPC